MSSPSVLLVSYHFYPSNEIGARRPTELARFLVDQGLRVTVVSAFGEQDVEPGSEVLPGVTAIPVRQPSRTFSGAVVSLKRKLSRMRGGAHAASASNPGKPPTAGSRPNSLTWLREAYFRVAQFLDEYKRWGLRARRAAIREGQKHPKVLVLSSSPPLSVLWTGTLVARRLGVPHIADLRDPWSDRVADSHPSWYLDLAVQRRIERWAMASAAAITSTTATVIRLLTDRQPELARKTFVVRNGYDGGVRLGSASTGGRLAIFFAGNLYFNRDPLPFLRAVGRLLSRPDVEPSLVSVTFMGRMIEPFERAVVTWLADARCSSVVNFGPPQSDEAVAAATARCTVVLNLAQRQPMSVPAKTFEHLASGRENLLLCEDDSETARLVASLPGVVQVDPRDPAALDRALFDLYDRHVNHGLLRAPREQDVFAFSREAANREFWRIMQAVATLQPPAASKISPC